jgi:hypothetical protein
LERLAVSGFSPAWLALREPADAAARSRAVMKACTEAFAAQPSISVCDLGAGTGASLRAFSGMLPDKQHWTLVDHDAGNLAAALKVLAAWAGETLPHAGGLQFRRGAKHITVTTRVHDFAGDPACWPQATDLVTASALFDLASARWIDAFVSALAKDRVPLLSTLTFDGLMGAAPQHHLDEAVFAAFREHQTRDKGFGAAAGPAAARHLETALIKEGYTAAVGESPWRLNAAQAELLQATTDGIAAAAGETGAIDTARLAQWRTHSRDSLVVGHRDVFACF